MQGTTARKMNVSSSRTFVHLEFAKTQATALCAYVIEDLLSMNLAETAQILTNVLSGINFNSKILFLLTTLKIKPKYLYFSIYLLVRCCETQISNCNPLRTLKF